MSATFNFKKAFLEVQIWEEHSIAPMGLNPDSLAFLMCNFGLDIFSPTLESVIPNWEQYQCATHDCDEDLTECCI